MSEHYYTSATELASGVRRREISPVEVVDNFLERIDERNDELGAYTTIIADEARRAATDIEATLRQGDDPGPLAGVPIALKDLYGCKEGVRHTRGSVPFRDNIADNDAALVARLEDAGAIVLGMTNTPEFGHKGTTDNHLFGPTSTPYDLDRNAGGSSGGSAAAVVDGLATLTHGGDAGGSLRIPAAWCGAYAIKPTYRRIPSLDRPNGFSGVLGYSVNHGPITRTVADAALMLDVMAGPHPRDPTCLPDPTTNYRAATTRSISDLEIAYTPDLGTFPVDDRVKRIVDDAVTAFEDGGATVESVSVDLDHSHRKITETWRTLVGVTYAAMAETMADEQGIELAGDHRDELTPEVVELIQTGQSVSASEYLRLHAVRTDLVDAIVDVFEEYDLLVTPTVAHPPVENASDGSTVGPSEVDGEPVDPLIGWCLTHPFNFTGHPAASIPAGFTDDSLPVGMQLVGPRFDDGTVLAASAAFERLRPWHGSYPPR